MIVPIHGDNREVQVPVRAVTFLVPNRAVAGSVAKQLGYYGAGLKVGTGWENRGKGLGLGEQRWLIGEVQIRQILAVEKKVLQILRSEEFKGLVKFSTEERIFEQGGFTSEPQSYLVAKIDISRLRPQFETPVGPIALMIFKACFNVISSTQFGGTGEIHLISDLQSLVRKRLCFYLEEFLNGEPLPGRIVW